MAQESFVREMNTRRCASLHDDKVEGATSLFGRYIQQPMCTFQLIYRPIKDDMYVYLGADTNTIFRETQMAKAKITVTTQFLIR